MVTSQSAVHTGLRKGTGQERVLSGAAAKQQPVEGQAVPGLLTRVLPGGSTSSLGGGWVSVLPRCVPVLPRTCRSHAALRDPAALSCSIELVLNLSMDEAQELDVAHAASRAVLHHAVEKRHLQRVAALRHLVGVRVQPFTKLGSRLG